MPPFSFCRNVGAIQSGQGLICNLWHSFVQLLSLFPYNTTDMVLDTRKPKDICDICCNSAMVIVTRLCCSWYPALDLCVWTYRINVHFWNTLLTISRYDSFHEIRVSSQVHNLTDSSPGSWLRLWGHKAYVRRGVKLDKLFFFSQVKT